jgi:putative oxidoreductase
MLKNDDLGKFLLRVTLAVLILLHGIAKIMGGPDSILGAVAKIGLPPAFGYLVYIGEVLAPLLLLLGIWSRLAAAIIAINMVVAIWLVHSTQLFELGKTGGWALELQGMFLIAALALVFLGPGRYSIGGSGGRFN